jgi:hypothetical protein
LESMAAKKNFETGKKRDIRSTARDVSKKNSLKLIRGCSMWGGLIHGGRFRPHHPLLAFLIKINQNLSFNVTIK